MLDHVVEPSLPSLLTPLILCVLLHPLSGSIFVLGDLLEPLPFSLRISQPAFVKLGTNASQATSGCIHNPLTTAGHGCFTEQHITQIPQQIIWIVFIGFVIKAFGLHLNDGCLFQTGPMELSYACSASHHFSRVHQMRVNSTRLPTS